MYLSKLFIPLLKENPSEAKIKSHQLMLRAGMIKQSSAGIYSWLPLGFKIMKKEKCISKGVTIGGDNADVYMPQFISFFKNIFKATKPRKK